MTIRHDSRSRIRTCAAARTTTRRLSPCYRNPDDPITGICASCLRERLSGLDTAPAPNAAQPELRRCRSVASTSRCEASSSGLNEPRRKSCDVVSARASLSNLFDVDDLKSGSGSEAKVESKNVGLLRDACTSMKEYIDLEFGNKSKKTKDLRDIAGNIFGGASVFSKKLRMWRQKHSKIKENKNNAIVAGNDGRKFEENRSEIMGRRSCDIEPRFSVDGGRISFEEPRASWDGLAPMFSAVESGILGNASRFENHRLSVDGPMQSIIEDESSSGASGSGHSNSDSSSSMRRSSFDRSGKADELEKLGSTPRNVAVLGGGNMNASAKKSVRWRKVCNVLGFRNKNCENVGETLRVDAVRDAAREKQAKEASELLRDVGDWKLARSSSVAASRKSCDSLGSYYARRSVDNAGAFTLSEKGNFKLERNRSTKFPSVDLDNGVTPFYMTPLRSMRNSKSGKFKFQNSHSIAGNLLQLN
ncbi:hypothetical protein SASPL_138246 [Salvia splendens]|uniref:Uncharacterized protein n=1 Tax=Salvia splendens TaxID=180675 RepID=A0A8X8WVZ5_SALSN|nr:hypothetical protein SASPL_138246 [Salvia splendens]